MFAAKDRQPNNAAVSSRPANLASPARISSNLRQDSQTPLLAFSRLRTLSPVQKFQRPYFHSLPHSFTHEKKITPAFSTTPALFLRSFARVQVSTLLFSCAHALFSENTREGVGSFSPVFLHQLPRTLVLLEGTPIK
jgi:hypothetical protein